MVLNLRGINNNSFICREFVVGENEYKKLFNLLLREHNKLRVKPLSK